MKHSLNQTQVNYCRSTFTSPSRDGVHNLLFISFLLLFTSLTGFSQTAEPATAGDGSQGNPYQIATLGNLYWISQYRELWDQNFIQTADIDATATNTFDSGNGFSPIGVEGVDAFTGTYNGNNKKIINLYINRSGTVNNQALFGLVEEPAVLKNIRLENVSISCGGEFAGALMAKNVTTTNVTVDNCYSTGAVSAKSFVGGLLGGCIGTITNSYSTCNVTGINESAGGFIGICGSSTVITNCFSDGDVTGYYYVGGFIGYHETGSKITACYTKGTTKGNGGVGGFCGLTNGTIENCYAWNNVTRVSGSTETQIGSFIGQTSNATVNHCYTLGTVTYTGATNPTGKGFIGTNSGSLTAVNNINGSEITLQTTGYGATAISNVNMKKMKTYTDYAWDFMCETTIGINDYWGINTTDNNQYPFLKFQGYTPVSGFAGGTGIETDPFLITTPAELNNVRNYLNTADVYFKVMQNIDMTAYLASGGEGYALWDSQKWLPLGDVTYPFLGVFDGNNKIISNLSISRSNDYEGLFGYANGSAVFKNVRIENFSLTNGGNKSGALLGGSSSSATLTIDNCYSTGSLDTPEIFSASDPSTFKSNVGGLIGYLSGTITNSYSTCAISKCNSTGGLIGSCSSTTIIRNCYASGNITGNAAVGGFIGTDIAGANILACYAKGTVTGQSGVGGFSGKTLGTITNCYSWGNVTRPQEPGVPNTEIGSFTGLVSSAAIKYCYTLGSVTYGGTTNPVTKGFAGAETGTNTYTSNFFNTTTTSQTSGIGATSKTTEPMQTFSIYTSAGWDFINETGNGTNDYWGINTTDNNKYPFLSFQGFTNQTPCAIFIPDANFKAALVAIPGIDTNSDGEVECSEAAAYTGEIDVHEKNIANMTGIEAFTKITGLYCNINSITTLDVSALTLLTTLVCNNNQLTTLDVSSNTQLQNLLCGTNLLTSVNTSGLTSLVYFGCVNNEIDSLSVALNLGLKGLYCSNNHLTSLNVNGLSSLETIYCDYNQLLDLDFHSNTSLTKMTCSNNIQLASLDVKNGNNINFTSFDVKYNPDLYCIQVDDVVYSNTNWSDKKDVGASYSAKCDYCLVNIPDANLKAALMMKPGLDANSDGKIECSEAEACTGNLKLANQNIADFTGLEAFTNVTEINCGNNQNTSLDLTSNTALVKLNCSSSSSHSLTSLNVSGLKSLNSIDCRSNQITTLDLSTNTALATLLCGSNALTSLNVSGLKSLSLLNCGSNQLTTLDVSTNSGLNNLSCSNNSLSSLNVKNGNNTNISNFNATSNPGLTCIQVDDVAYSTTNWTNKDAGASYNTSCGMVTETSGIGKSSWLVYPNPVSDELIVEAENLHENASFKIINSVGQVINAGTLMTKTSIQTSHFPMGIYLLKVENGKTFEIKKIIKK